MQQRERVRDFIVVVGGFVETGVQHDAEEDVVELNVVDCRWRRDACYMHADPELVREGVDRVLLPVGGWCEGYGAVLV